MSQEEERVGLDTDELPRAKEACTYMADRRLLERVQRLEREAGRLVREPSLRLYAGELPNHLEPRDWRAGYLAVRELDPTDYWLTELHEVSPQALLRDLYRPERETFYCELELQPPIDRGGAMALAEARAAQKREPLPRVAPLVKEVVSHRDAWRRMLRERWKPILDDEQPRKHVFVHRDPSINW